MLLYLRCPSWENRAGSLITAKSTCQGDTTWSDTIPFPPGPLFVPRTLNKPDGPDMICKTGCKPLNMTYNPNKELGAEFYCSSPLAWEDLPVRVEPSNQCNLLCDHMLVAVTECRAGVWTGQPGLGYWCSREREGIQHWLEDHYHYSKEPASF